MLRKSLVILLALIVMGGTTVAFAWWDRLTVTNAENDIVNIGQGLELEVVEAQINPTEAGKLIPASAILKEGDTHEVVLSYTVRLDAEVVETLNLVVTVEDIKVGTVENPYGLINIEIDNPGTLENEDVVVTLTVTIDDSELQETDYTAAYEALANKAISFTVTFAASR